MLPPKLRSFAEGRPTRSIAASLIRDLEFRWFDTGEVLNRSDEVDRCRGLPKSRTRPLPACNSASVDLIAWEIARWPLAEGVSDESTSWTIRRTDRNLDIVDSHVGQSFPDSGFTCGND